jgi:hypothetical protein
VWTRADTGQLDDLDARERASLGGGWNAHALPRFVVDPAHRWPVRPPGRDREVY